MSPNEAEERIQQGRHLAVQGLVIVVSILLAFALDAGWDRYQEQRRLTDTMQQLRDQLATNRRDLSQATDRNRSASIRMSFFLESTPDRLRALPADSAASIVLSLSAKNFYDQNGGAIESFAASGDMELVKDEELRPLLAFWSTMPEELEEDAAGATAADEQVRRVLSVHGATAAALNAIDELRIPNTGDANRVLGQMRADPAAVDIIAMKYAGVSSYVRNLEAMRQVFDALEPLLRDH